jgi:hypothetical protein
VGVEVEVMLKEFLKSSLDIGKRLELWSGHMDPDYVHDDRLVGSQRHSHGRKRGICGMKCKPIGERWALSVSAEQCSLMRTYQQVGILNRRETALRAAVECTQPEERETLELCGQTLGNWMVLLYSIRYVWTASVI